MILQESTVDRSSFAAWSGWELKPEGACKGDVCIPMPAGQADPADPTDPTRLDTARLAAALALPLVHDETANVWALGPESIGGRTLSSAVAPELVLPDLDGKEFRLSSLRGKKVLLVAWAPY